MKEHDGAYGGAVCHLGYRSIHRCPVPVRGEPPDASSVATHVHRGGGKHESTPTSKPSQGERGLTARIDKAQLSTPPSRALRRAASSTIVGSALLAGFAWSAAAQAQAPCIDVARLISVEEQSLPNKLNALNANPFAVDILGASGFTHFEQDFIDEICGLNGKVAPNDYNSALVRMTDQGTRLWRAAVDRVQGRKVTQSDDLTKWPTLAKGDDRPLYWARTTMTRALNRGCRRSRCLQRS